MPITKVLNRIQSQIAELKTALEAFTEPSVLPSASDCERLQKQLCDLQECLAVFKFSQTEKEFSPSFMIHAKVSEKEPAAVKTEDKQDQQKAAETRPAEKDTPKDSGAEEAYPKKEKPVSRSEAPATQSNNKHKALTFGINDKFRFINELFSQNNSEYNIAFQQLNNLNSWNESEIYLNSLRNLYGWKENSDVVKYLYSLVRKRFE
jgi:hypothetical protein